MARACVSQTLVLIYEATWADVPGDRYVKGGGGSALKINCSINTYGVFCFRVLA